MAAKKNTPDYWKGFSQDRLNSYQLFFKVNRSYVRLASNNNKWDGLPRSSSKRLFYLKPRSFYLRQLEESTLKTKVWLNLRLFVFNSSWIQSLEIYYKLAYTGSKLPLIMGNTTTLEANSYTSESVDARTFLALIVSWALLGLVSAGLNILVCAMVYIDKKLRTMTNYLVVSLSVSDLLVAVVFVPVYIIDHYARTIIGGYFVAFILLATVFNLCGVTYERYIALTRPFRYRAIISCQKVSVIIGISWILPLLLSLFPLAWNNDARSTIHKVYLAIILATCIFIPCTTMVCVYMRLLRVVHRFVMRNKKRTCKGNNTGYRAGNEEKAARVFAIVLVMFLVCWLPLIYINICLISDQKHLVTNELIFVSFYTLVLNSILDPVIFALYKKDFREMLKKRLKLKCFGKEANNRPKVDSDLALRKISSKSKNVGEETDTEPKNQEPRITVYIWLSMLKMNADAFSTNIARKIKGTFINNIWV